MSALRKLSRAAAMLGAAAAPFATDVGVSGADVVQNVDEQQSIAYSATSYEGSTYSCALGARAERIYDTEDPSRGMVLVISRVLKNSR